MPPAKENADSEAPSEIFSHSEPPNDFKTPSNKDGLKDQPDLDVSKGESTEKSNDGNSKVDLAQEINSKPQMQVVQEAKNEGNESSS